MESSQRPDEPGRLARLRALAVLDSAPEPLFDNLVQLASEACGTPIALLSLIDADRQWFKANVGLPGLVQTPRRQAVCDHTIRTDGLLEVPDLLADARFSADVQGSALRFYAGAPLVMAGGERVGTLCVMDRQARRLTPAQAGMLARLAQAAVQGLEMRQRLLESAQALRSGEAQQLAAREAHLRAMLDAQTDLVSQALPDGRLVYVNPAYAAHFGLGIEAVVGTNLFDYVDPADVVEVRERIASVLASGRSVTAENRMRRGDGEVRWISWTNARQVDAEGRPLLHSTGRDISDRVRAEQARRTLQQQVADNEHFLRLLTDSLPVRIAYLDGERRYRFVNQQWLSRTGLQREQVIGRTRRELWPGEDDQTMQSRALAALAGTAQHFEFDETVAGQRLRIENRLIPDRADSGAVRGFFVTGIDITERSRAEAALARQAATLRSVADAMPATVAVLDALGRYRFVNQAFALAVGRPAEQILGLGVREFLGDAEFERRMPFIRRALAGEMVSFELHHESREGLRHTALDYIPLHLPDGAVDGFVEVAQDVTQQKREQMRLRILSETDPLTGLLNRAGFEHRLANALDETRAESLAVLYIDLDHFKPVNDTHGHGAGDELLKIFAKRLVRLVRPSDAVARLGGDEFAVLLPGMHDIGQARRVAQQIVESAHRPFTLGGGVQAHIAASVGGALGQAVRRDWRRLLERADRLLYQAKADGRNRYAVDPG